MTNPLLSVVIPVYHVENYIRQCLDSVLTQTYTNMEIMIVDDGGKDGSLAICQEYARIDERIRIISQENGGLSKARNVGVQHSTASYITFIDSDDFIHPKMFETMMKLMQENGVDIVSCGSTRKEIEAELGSGEITTFHHDTLVSMGLCDQYVSAWGKIYKRHVLETVPFPEGRVFEDLGTLYKIFNESNGMVYVDYRFYHYIKRPNSITQTSFRVKPKYDCLYLTYKKIEFAQEHGYTEELHYIHSEVIKSAISLLTVFGSNASLAEQHSQEYADAKHWLAEAMHDTQAWKETRTKEHVLWFLYDRCTPLFKAFSKLSKWSKGLK